ncbi:MAG TPA: serine hydrolase [Pyrinomonadaceae bacterium]|nr:serine hydrolase [Pyrinomonadaceae bacterium]
MRRHNLRTRAGITIGLDTILAIGGIWEVRRARADLIKNNLIFLIVFIGLFLCGTHITTAQVKKVSLPTVQKAKTPGLQRGQQVQKKQESSVGTKPDNEIAEAAIKDKADALAAQYLANGSGGVGLVIGVIDGDRRMILSYGETKRGNGQKPKTNTIFQIGSITKVFTATLLAIYAEKNVVNYNDPLQKYVPTGITVPSRDGRKISLLDLATHYSGLPKTVTTAGPTSINAAYDILENTSLLSKPGDTWAYSNLGFGFLALAVADSASAPGWASLVEKDIAKPLNLVDTTIDLNAAQTQRRAQGYNKTGNSTQSAMPGWPGLGGAGQLYSTPDDMMKFLSFNMGLTQTPLNSILPDLQKSWRPITGKTRKFQGLGWQIVETKTRTLWKNGGTPGFRSYIAFCKAKKSGVFVLSNSLQLNSTDLGQELLGFLTGDPLPSAGTPDE